jgi:hypothetical protein
MRLPITIPSLSDMLTLLLPHHKPNTGLLGKTFSVLGINTLKFRLGDQLFVQQLL